MDPILIMGINEFADLCGCFFNAEFHDLSLPSCNNGYNCKHQEQTEGRGFDTCRRLCRMVKIANNYSITKNYTGIIGSNKNVEKLVDFNRNLDFFNEFLI